MIDKVNIYIYIWLWCFVVAKNNIKKLSVFNWAFSGCTFLTKSFHPSTIKKLHRGDTQTTYKRTLQLKD